MINIIFSKMDHSHKKFQIWATLYTWIMFLFKKN